MPGPRVVGHRLIPAAAALALLVGLIPAAQADDDPAKHKAEVEAQMAEVRGDLAESTAAVAAAVKALDAVDAQLDVARQALATAQGELDVAEAEDLRLAGELAAAQAEETGAEQELVAIQADIDDNQALMGGLARAAYQGTSMNQFSAAFDATSMEDFTRKVEGMRTVMRSQNAALLALGNDRAALATTQAKLEAIRERVATAKAAAAANVAEKARLEAIASEAEAQVEALRDERAQVLASAEDAQAEDEAQYAALEAERKSLEAELRRRAEAAAAAAAAAAAQGSSSASTMSSGPLYRPVLGPITSHYGMRTHPITGIYKLHDGTDFGVGCGTPIRAAASGTVLRTYYTGGYGNQTVIEHGVINGRSVATSYSHQSRFAVSSGQHVDRGQLIGYVGTTGYSTGCHLHFMVYVNGSTTNPMNWL